MFDWLLEFVGGSAWAYPAIFAIVATDAFFPVVPGETSVITGAILAANGELSIVFVCVAAVTGALAGDNISFLLGDRFGTRAQARLFTSERAQARVCWARDQLHDRGPWIIVGARFVPGGRTAATFSAGSLDYPWRRFFAAAVVAAVLWSALSVSLGWFGGSAYENSLWKPLLIALGIAAVVAVAGEVYRRMTDRRHA